ncbi:MAG TPA: polysaccharide deacetylase family protein [Acidimicrobiia bacterium]|nr:polysaccharide deacetylase family protein [Acidimicrobiia bacterium]
MADQLTFPTRGPARRPADRWAFVAFCAAMVALICAIVLTSPFGPRRATAALGGADGGRTVHRTGGAAGEAAADVPPDAPPPDSTNPALRRIAALGEPVYCGAGTRPLVALTFDDGPGPYTQETIDLLRANGMTATFFTVGKLYADPRFQGLLREEARLGAVGDHTWDHVSVDGMTRSELDAEIEHTRQVASSDAGAPVFLFRPPLGQHDAGVDDYLRSHGMIDVLWSLDSEDSQGANAFQIYRNVRDHLSPGDIVLLHENRGTTQAALPRILDLVRARGFQTVTVPQLLTMDPPSNEQLRSHTCP